MNAPAGVLDRIRSFFAREMSPEVPDDEEHSAESLRVAACALLLEVAHADDYFGARERRHLRELVRRHFGLDAGAADELIVLAEDERRDSVDLWGFTKLINAHYSDGQKLVLLESMWGVVLADGELAGREDYLMRRISHLIGLKPGYLAEARQRHDSGAAPARRPSYEGKDS